MATTKNFPKEYLTDELGLPYDSPNVELDEVVGNSRWTIKHRIIFRVDGDYWQTFYDVGATENQEMSPWEYDNEVTCTKVEKHLVMVTQWVVV